MEQYVKIQRIADDLAHHPLLRDIPYDRIINYAFELIRIVGCPKLYVDKVEQVGITEYQGILPCDFVEIISVAGCDGREYVSTMDNFFVNDPCRKDGKGCGIGGIIVRQEQKTEGCSSYLETKVTAYAPTDKYTGVGTYKIQGNIVYVDVPSTTIKVAYRSIPMDENGFPMLPNVQSFIRAIEAYIKVRQFEIMFDTGKVSPAVYQNAQQEYTWAVGQAQADLVMPTQDELETFSHMWNTLIPRTREHRNGFATAHLSEHLRRH